MIPSDAQGQGVKGRKAVPARALSRLRVNGKKVLKMLHGSIFRTFKFG